MTEVENSQKQQHLMQARQGKAQSKVRKVKWNNCHIPPGFESGTPCTLGMCSTNEQQITKPTVGCGISSKFTRHSCGSDRGGPLGEGKRHESTVGLVTCPVIVKR